MYKVFYNDSEFARLRSIEDAIGLCLSLHRASNLRHTISVYDSVNDHDLLVLTNESDPKSVSRDEVQS